MSLVEIGPRFVLQVMRIFDGSFCGSTLYKNGDFVSPNTVRIYNSIYNKFRIWYAIKTYNLKWKKKILIFFYFILFFNLK